MKFCRQAVRAHRQVGEDVLAAGPGDDKPRHSSAGLRDSDFHAGKGATRFVDDSSGQLRDRYGLTERGTRESEEYRGEKQQSAGHVHSAIDGTR